MVKCECDRCRPVADHKICIKAYMINAFVFSQLASQEAQVAVQRYHPKVNDRLYFLFARAIVRLVKYN
jgi:hypothetical protein